MLTVVALTLLFLAVLVCQELRRSLAEITAQYNLDALRDNMWRNAFDCKLDEKDTMFMHINASIIRLSAKIKEISIWKVINLYVRLRFQPFKKNFCIPDNISDSDYVLIYARIEEIILNYLKKRHVLIKLISYCVYPQLLLRCTKYIVKNNYVLYSKYD